MRLLQHRRADGRRSVITATEAGAWLLPVTSVRALAARAIAERLTIESLVARMEKSEPIDIESELNAGRLLAPIDHDDPTHLFMSGTGLTHLGSAEGRDRMHRELSAEAEPTDSMKMFLEGLEGGKPRDGKIGPQPEWFYKGDGSQIAPPESSLGMPDFALDGGEEPELAGIYLIGPDGTPFRIGICLANEFSDHVTERHNYLWLAHSKLRAAALGPEILVGDIPRRIEGASRIVRNGRVLWESPFLTGEDNMSHSIDNLERHHFKYAQFRRPGDVHVHFFGTATLSHSEGIICEEGDRFEIEAPPFALPLRNWLQRTKSNDVQVRAL